MIGIDIKMPESCEDCPFREERDANDDSEWSPGDPRYYSECRLKDYLSVSDDNGEPLKTRHKACPLIDDVAPKKEPTKPTAPIYDWHCPKCGKHYFGTNKCENCGITVK